MLEQLRLEQSSIFVGDNLIIVALHHEGRHCDRFEIVGLVCLTECLDVFVDFRLIS
jgi:hypothetical protein